MIVILDPGHGGTDPGAVGNGQEEKNINLDLTLKVQQYLERLGHEVWLTRSGDIFLSLEDRVDIANKKSYLEGVGCFVSIHTNSAEDPNARGAEVWFPNRTSDSRAHQAGFALAYCVDRFMTAFANPIDRGVKIKTEERSDFYVIRKTAMPAVLVECGFLSNQIETNLLGQQWYKEKLAVGITQGIHYFAGIPQ